MNTNATSAGDAHEPDRTDVLAWARHYLPEYFSDEPALFHAELMADLQAAEKKLIARVAPRGHAKSTCAALAYPLWCICEQQRRNIVIVTHESSLATQFVRDIRHELETNERILADYGELFGSETLSDEVTPEDMTPDEQKTKPRSEVKKKTATSAPKKKTAARTQENKTAAKRKTTTKATKKITATKSRQNSSSAISKKPTKASKTNPNPLRQARGQDGNHSEKPKARKKTSTNKKTKSPKKRTTETNPAKTTKPRPKKTTRKWSSAIFTTNTGITVQAKGTGASLRGVRVGPHRPDLVICDDLEKDEHVATSEGRAKLEHWVRRVVMPSLAPDGQLLVLGSIIHHDSLLAGLADRKRWPRWDYRVYRALEAERRNDGNYYRVALWPSRWPVARLDQERERIGTLAFEQEYQANPIDDSLRVFRPEWLRRYDEADIANQNWPHLMAVDPATGTTGGDFFALWVGAIDPATTTIYTRELLLERVGIVKQVRRILSAFERWQPLRIGIETVAYQVALKEILEEESRKRGLYMPIVALKTATNKRTRIEGSSVLFENGLFRLPASLSAEAEKQFLEYPKSRHDDAPDVCAMGIELARSLRAFQKVEGITRHEQNGRRGDGW